jgi:hypothetical protein
VPEWTAGTSVTVGTQGGSCPIATGTHTIAIVADDANRVTETNKKQQHVFSDNHRPTWPDLHLDLIRQYKRRFTSVVANQGNAATLKRRRARNQNPTAKMRRSSDPRSKYINRPLALGKTRFLEVSSFKCDSWARAVALQEDLVYNFVRN